MRIRSFILLCVAACLLAACHRNEFAISGIIADGNSKTIYLEHNGLKESTVIDSLKLNERGEFKFYAPRPEYPDLYQLRVENRRFIFSIDSTEELRIETKLGDLAFPTAIEGSENTRNITMLRKSVRDLQKEYESFSNGENAEFVHNLAKHRAMSDSLIMSDTKSIVAYFAIFQRIGQYYIYSPYEKSDRVYCAAVATAFKAYMPEYDRSLSLEAWVLDALRTEKKNANLLSLQDMIDNAKNAELDVELFDKNGDIRRLSDLKGKVVLLDFSRADMRNSAGYVLQLRELYNKYHNRGLEIFQVSADDDVSTWIKATSNLPWICVREDNRTTLSSLRTFNVNVLPTMFIVNRKGEIMSRHQDFSSISKDIEKYLTNR